MKKLIKKSLIEPNDGQIDGLEKNPRFIRDEKYLQLLASVKEDPEFLEVRGLIVMPHKKKYVVIGGNQRLRACIEAGMEEIPCDVLRKDTPVAKLKSWTVKDNAHYGEWDYGFIEVSDWLEVIQSDENIGLDLPVKMQEHLDSGFKEKSQHLNLDYTIFFNTKEECDMFHEFMIRLKNRFSKSENVSRRILQWIAEIYEENEEIEESQLLLKMIEVDMRISEDVKPEKKNYKDVQGL